MEPDGGTLGARLKAARERRGLSQVEAARAIGCSTGSLSAYEQGGRGVADDVLGAMAQLYGVHVAVLRYGDVVIRLAAAEETARRVADAAASLQALADVIGLSPPPAADPETPRIEAAVAKLKQDATRAAEKGRGPKLSASKPAPQRRAR